VVVIWVVRIHVAPVANLELGTMLVEGHGVAEMVDRIGRRLAQGQAPRDEADARNAIEDANEVDFYMGAKCALEARSQVAPVGRIVLVELVREVHLRTVARWQ
jgi:hypothetical protein